jgi:hypothetical protein
MSLFSKKGADHVGSGLDKPDPKSLLQTLKDALTPTSTAMSVDAADATKEAVVTLPVASAGSD